MLINTNEVAERLKITNRAVQNKCKNAGLVKIGNQYQITNDIADQWYKEAERKERTDTQRTEHTPQTSQRRKEKPFVYTSLVIAFCVLVTFALIILFYFNLSGQIVEAKATIIKNDSIYKAEVKELTKKLYDTRDIVKNQESEIQILKFKDSLRVFKKW